MGGGRESLRELAREYALEKGFAEGSAKFTQRVSQFLKSNTGKMFERFIGLSLAYSFLESDAPFCIQPFREGLLKNCHGASSEDFKVDVTLGDAAFTTKIDADLFCFNPDDPAADIYLISIKSTLKDRFHNVPFWNLLRLACIHQIAPNLSARDSEFLDKLKYVAICSDLAEEQPDFASDDGPRNLLGLDAALLDGAYVSASRARGLGSGENHFGLTREYPFYPLSDFFEMLANT